MDAEANQLGDDKAECWKIMYQQLGWIFCETSRRLSYVLSVYGERGCRAGLLSVNDAVQRRE